MKLARAADFLQRHADAAIAASAFFIVALVAAYLPAWQALERRAFDALTVHTAPGELKQPIVLIAIDDESIRQMQLEWPWPRSLHAELVNRVAQGGAAVIALDIIFDTPAANPKEDEAFARAIAKAGNVILAADFREKEEANFKRWVLAEPIAPYIDAGALAGRATVAFDPDQFVRHVPPEPDAFWRQIIKVLQVKAPAVAIPPLPGEGALIRFMGPDTIFDPMPYHLVLKATPEELKGAFEGRIVIVGRDLRAAPELGLASSDLFATPFFTQSGAPTAGMKVHATIVDNAISGASLQALRPAGNAALAALAGLLVFLGMRRWRPVIATATLAVVITTFAVMAWYMFVHERLWIGFATPVAVAVLAYVGYVIRAYLLESRRKREVQNAFSRYVSPELVQQIVNDPKRLTLGGEEREITVLFTDLAGFTKLTEKSKPQDVQKILIQHFTAMTDIILAKKGTVVQFIGDAVMAFWGAPLDDPEHGLHAVQAAVEMQAAMEELRAGLRKQGLPEIHMRVGVNTCTAIVGNMGSESRLAYTAMGDGINLASRLEGSNKFWKTKIIASGETVAKLTGRVPMRRVDRVRVSGKSEAVDVFTPCTDPAILERTAVAFDAYLRRDWALAAELYGKLLQDNPEDGVARRLLERIEEWRSNPSTASDDGSIALDKL